MFERFEVIRDADMRQYTTLRLGGAADWLAFPRNSAGMESRQSCWKKPLMSWTETGTLPFQPSVKVMKKVLRPAVCTENSASAKVN